LGYDIKFPQEFAVFSPQSSSTLWNEQGRNSKHTTIKTEIWTGILRKHSTIALTRTGRILTSRYFSN
jgi:hypothetical protein